MESILTKYNYHQILGLKLKPTTKAIIDNILSYTNKKGFCYPSQQLIADNLGLCRQTVASHLKKISDIKINNMPFVIIKAHRQTNGKYNYNTYFFPWMVSASLYVKIYQGSIFDQLQKEYVDLTLQEEIHSYHVKYFNTNLYRKKTVFSLEKVREIVSKLSNIFKLSKGHTLRILNNVGYEIKENKTEIYNLEKYLVKCFQNAGVNKDMEEIINNIYLSFFNKENKNALFFVDWNKIAEVI